MEQKIKTIMLVLAIGLLAASCSTPKLGYFQDVQPGVTQQLSDVKRVRIQAGDKLSILVSSQNPSLAYAFNLPIVGSYSSSVSNSNLSNQRVSTYKVDTEGNIMFPVLGTLHIAGMTQNEIAEMIQGRLRGENLLSDAMVTVDFLDLYFSVMGEVSKPGRFVIDHDKVTLLDALSQAGDLTIYGRRDNVLVMREEGGNEVSYRVDLSNAQQLYNSPAFYLKQNDIIYVEPNDRKARESTMFGNDLYRPSLWISLASLLVTISVLIWK